MNYGVMYEYVIDKNSSQYKAPFNKLYNMRRVATPEDTAIVTPNSDTPYSLGFMDLRAEPIVISVPAIEKSRYYSVQLCDGNTFNYGYIGTRATGSEAGHYMVVGPNWKGEAPPGIKKVFNSTTEFSMVILRTQLFNPADMPNVIKIQEGYKVQPLSAFLVSVFGRPGLVLHGEIPVQTRQSLVRQFQEDEAVPFFLLSLKAGGFGLNLTAASHVIHFDRWWNPAVENQATDRAFRIGQTKNVLVQKFVCRGTVEEKIDVLLEAKQELSDELLKVETDILLTEMKDEELLKLVALDIHAARLE